VGGIIGTLLCVGLALFIILRLRRRRETTRLNPEEAVDEVSDTAPELPPRRDAGVELEDSGIAEKDGSSRCELPSPCLAVELEGSLPPELPQPAR
jgi:hypothetical protein